MKTFWTLLPFWILIRSGRGCTNTDYGAADPYGDACDAYDSHPSWCGGYDDSDFTSNEMCCICGGGFTAHPTPHPYSPTPEPSATHKPTPAAVCEDTCYGQSCDYWDELGYSCEVLESTYNCGCGGCDCDDEGSSGRSCDGCGASATYAEVITTSEGYSKRTITTSGCPNHYSICTGKPRSDGVCGDIGAEGTASEASDLDQTIAVPGEPVLARSTTNIECDMGAIAVALNGVAIYAGAVNTQCDLLDVEDDSSEASYAPLQHVPSQPLLGVSVLSSTL